MGPGGGIDFKNWSYKLFIAKAFDCSDYWMLMRAIECFFVVTLDAGHLGNKKIYDFALSFKG